MGELTNKDLQDAFMEGFCYAEDIGHTTGKKLAAEAERRYPATAPRKGEPTMLCVLLREWTEEYRTSDDNYEPPEPDMNADGPAERAHRQDEARRMK